MKQLFSIVAFSFLAFTAFGQRAQYGAGYNNTQIPNYSTSTPAKPVVKPAPNQCYNQYQETSRTSPQHSAGVNANVNVGKVGTVGANYQYTNGQTTTSYGTCVPVCAPNATPIKRDRENCDQPRRRN